MEDNILEQLTRRKCVDIFIGIGGTYLSRVSRDVDMTYSHANKLAVSWVKQGLLSRKKRHREAVFTYTERGEKLRDILIQLRKVTG